MTQLIKDASGNALVGITGSPIPLPESVGVIDRMPFSLVTSAGRVIFSGVAPTDDTQAYWIQLFGLVEGVRTTWRKRIPALDEGDSPDIGSVAEIYGPFESVSYDEMIVAIEVASTTALIPVVHITSQPQAPGQVTFHLEESEESDDPGTFKIIIDLPLPTSGDGNAVDDGLGGDVYIDYDIDRSENWFALSEEVAAEGTFTVLAEDEGKTIEVRLRSRTSFRNGYPSEPQPIKTKDPDVIVGDPPVDLGLMSDKSMLEGETFTADFDEYVTDFTSAVFTSDLPGIRSIKLEGASVLPIKGVEGNKFGFDPGFVNAATKDFHLVGGSALVDAGTNAFGFRNPDLDGIARISGSVNIGCYEQVDVAPVRQFMRAGNTGATKYVRKGGSDAAAGTTGAPWLTIGYALSQITAGDTIIVGDGTWAESVQISIACTLKAENIGLALIRPATIAHGIRILTSNVTVDGFDVQTGPGTDWEPHAIVSEGTHHISVLNCTAHDARGSGISLAWGDYYTVRGNTCYNNARAGWYSGITIFQARNITAVADLGVRIVVQDNICYDNYTTGGSTDGNGILIDDFNHTQHGYGGTGSTWDDVIYPFGAQVDNNLTYNNGNKGIGVTWCNNILVRNNTSYCDNTDPRADLGGSAVSGATWRGGISNQSGQDNTFTNNLAVANSAHANGGACVNATGLGNYTDQNVTGFTCAGTIFKNNFSCDLANLSGTYNTTTHVYVAEDLPAGNYTLLATWSNASGDTQTSWNISASSDVIAPAVNSLVPDDVVLTTGEHFRRDMGAYFTGTNLAYTVTPNNDPNFGLGTGSEQDVFKDKVTTTAVKAATTFRVTATNTAGSAFRDFKVQVVAGRAAALILNTDVKLDKSNYKFSGTKWFKPLITFPSNKDVQTGKVIKPVYTRRAPSEDTNSVDPKYYEYLENTKTTAPREWETQMDSTNFRGNPDDETVQRTAGANPIATTLDSAEITFTLSAHGWVVGRTINLTGATAVGGLTSSGDHVVTAVVDANKVKMVHSTKPDVATSTVTSGGGSAIIVKPRQANYSVWQASDARKIWFALEIDGIVSYWSNEASVPTPAVVGDDNWDITWLPEPRRSKALWNNGDTPFEGSEGKQFQHSKCWNRGSRNDSTKANSLFTGQDENGISFSPDGGETMCPVVSFGLWASGISGIYYNSDESILAVVGTYGFSYGRAGLFISGNDGTTFKYVKLMDGTREAFQPNTYFTRCNCNFIDRRPQQYNTAGVAQLTDAERPMYVLENTFKQGAQGIQYVKLWKWGGVHPITNSANWSVAYAWDAAAVRGDGQSIQNKNGGEAMLYVHVANNGWIGVGGRQGYWLSKDGGATFSKKYTGPIRGMGFDWTAGFNAAPGAMLATGINGPGQILRTNNVDTTAFAKPSGQTGLVANANLTSFEVARYNFDKAWVVIPTTNGVAASCKLTTNGAINWSAVSVNKPQHLPGNDNWRYGWNDRTASATPHPTDPLRVFAMTQQTAAYSSNGGTIFNPSIYFNHNHTKGAMFHNSNPEIIYRMEQDGGPLVTNAGVEWSEYCEIGWNEPAIANQAGTRKALGTWTVETANISGTPAGRMGGKGACVLPGTNRGIFLYANDGSHNKGVPVIFNDVYNTKMPSGQSQYPQTSVMVRTDKGTSVGSHSGYHPTIAGKAYFGCWWITNWDAATISDIGFEVAPDGREILGYSKEGGTYQWYYGGTGETGTSIKRSTVASGGNATVWKSASSAFLNTACAPDPFHHDRVYVARKTQKGKLHLLTNSGESLLYDFFEATKTLYTSQGLAIGSIPDPDIGHVVVDPNYDGLVYVVVSCAGFPVIWRSVNGGVAWEDITHNLSHTNLWRPFVHQLTGELMLGSSMGTWWLPHPKNLTPAYPTLRATVNGVPNVITNDFHHKRMRDLYYTSGLMRPPVLLPTSLPGA